MHCASQSVNRSRGVVDCDSRILNINPVITVACLTPATHMAYPLNYSHPRSGTCLNVCSPRLYRGLPFPTVHFLVTALIISPTSYLHSWHHLTRPHHQGLDPLYHLYACHHCDPQKPQD